MATATIPTIQNGGGPIDSLIASISKNFGGGSTQTTTGAFDNQLTQLLANLTGMTGPYSRQQAIADAAGPMAQLAQETLQSYTPRAAAQVRGSGLYNSSTKALLDNDANAKLATAMAGLVQKNITDYATINANNVNSAANANRTSSTQTTKQGTGGVGKALASAAVPLLLGEGKKLLGGLFDNDTAKTAASGVSSSLADSFGAPTARTDVMNIFDSGTAPTGVESGDQFLGSIGESLGDAASGIGDTLGNIGGDALGGIGDFLGNIGSNIGDVFGGITDSLGDLFGGLFADGGKVPIRDRGIGAAGDDRYGGGKTKETAPPPSSGISNLLKDLFPDNIFDRTQKKREKDSGLSSDAAGVINGPKSKTGADNMLIAVQGGEGILPPDVMEVPGVEELLNSLIERYHTPTGTSA